MKSITLAGLTLCAALALSVVAKAEAPRPKYPGAWRVISDGILSDLGKDHPKIQTAKKQTAGAAVDRTTGDVYLMANDIGICKSIDQGKTFTLVSGDNVTGRFETGWGINVDPQGKRLMCFSIYGSCAYSDDAGQTWKKSKVNHLDYGAVDWFATAKAMLAIGHESGGKLYYSTDAGANWKTLGRDFSAVGLFDPQTLVAVCKAGGFCRSTDAGQTWTKVSDEKLAAPVMVEFNNAGYWLGENGLLVSHDKGSTWENVAPLPQGACIGPWFGADESHMIVAATDGLYESVDSGKTWAFAVPLAPDIKVLKHGVYGNYAWDPLHNIFYASNMDKPAYRYVISDAPAK